MSVESIRWSPWLDDIDRILESMSSILDTIKKDPSNTEALENTKVDLHSAKGLLDSVGLKTATETIYELEEMVHQREAGFNQELIDMLDKAYGKLDELASVIKDKEPKTDEINEIDKTIGFESILVKFGRDYKLEIEIGTEKSLISARALSVLNSIKRFAIVNKSSPPEEDLFLDAKFDLFVVEITSRDDITEIKEKVETLPSVDNVIIEELVEELGDKDDEILDQDISIKVNLRDIRAIENGLSVLSSHVEAIKSEISTTKGLQELSGINRSFELIQSDIRKMRKVPLDSITAGFPSMVSRLAKQEGKNAELIVQGRFITLDRALANHIVDPITQILRNAVSHGIEQPVKRRELNKNPIGQIVLQAATDRDKIILKIKDDGAGIDLDHILEIANEKEIDVPDNPTENQIRQLIFKRGFSSKEEGSNISGRGIGLYAAKDRISKIGGILTVETTINEGTTFTIELSDSDALTKSLIFRVDQGRYGIPSVDIEHIQTIRMDEIERLSDTSGVTEYRDGKLPVAFLQPIIGGDGMMASSPNKQYIMLVARGAQSMIGLLIDEILDERLVNIRPLNPLLQSFNLFNGTLTGKNREVILVVNPASLL